MPVRHKLSGQFWQKINITKRLTSLLQETSLFALTLLLTKSFLEHISICIAVCWEIEQWLMVGSSRFY